MGTEFSLHPEDESIKVLRNVRILQPHYMASHPRRTRREYSQYRIWSYG